MGLSPTTTGVRGELTPEYERARSYSARLRDGGVSVKNGEETIRFATRGEDFKTVMAAIGTVPSQRLVTLEFQKCI